MNKLQIAFRLFITLISSLAIQNAFGDEFYKELNLTGGYSNTDHWVGTNGTNLKNSVGFEYFRIFSNEYGDFLKLDLQMRFAYDSRQDAENGFGLEIHNAWLEYKPDLGKTIRVGHFDPAFGLEPVLDTHGSMLQTSIFNNIGYKKDWGIGYRTYIGDYDIEMAAQLGSGMGIHFKNNYLLSTRISSVTDTGLEYGFSFLHGQTLKSRLSWTIPAADLVSEESVLRNRIGADIQCPLGPFRFLGELAVGTDDGTTVGGGMAQLEYDLPDPYNTTFKFQTLAWTNVSNQTDELNLMLAPVLEYRMSSNWTFRAGYFHDLFNPNENQQMFLLQLYYFGK